MSRENRQDQADGNDSDDVAYINHESEKTLVLGGVVPGFGMVWDPQYKYQIKIKPSEWVHIVALDVVAPDESNVPRNCSLILPSGTSVDFVSCRQTDHDNEVQRVVLPSKQNGYPEVSIEAGTSATIAVTTSEPCWRGRAVGAEKFGPIQVVNDNNAPVQFDVRCVVPGYGDALCPVLNLYYKKIVKQTS